MLRTTEIFSSVVQKCNVWLVTNKLSYSNIFSNYADYTSIDKHRIQAFFLGLRRKLWFVEEWKGYVWLCVLHAYLGVNFDGNPNWVLNFDFPKRVLNNARLGVILFQTWHLSQIKGPRVLDFFLHTPCFFWLTKIHGHPPNMLRGLISVKELVLHFVRYAMSMPVNFILRELRVSDLYCLRLPFVTPSWRGRQACGNSASVPSNCKASA